MKTLLTLAIIIAIAHCAWTVGTPRINHYFLDAKIRDMAGQGRLYNQYEMLNEIMRIVEEKKIPIDAKQIKFKKEKDGKRIKISVAYQQTVVVPFYTKTYSFVSAHSGIYDPKR